MNHSQLSMLQSLKQQQSGFCDMQQLQQQLILRKMQELQRQQQLQQLDARQQNAVNPFPPLIKQETGSYPSLLINGTASSDSLNNPWGTELGNIKWLHRAPVMQESSNGLVFSSNHGQGQRVMGIVPQQSDQSLCGVPVSGSRGNVTQFSKLATEKPSGQQMATSGNFLPANQYSTFTEQATIRDGSLITSQRFPGDNFLGFTSSQALSPVMNMENLQQVNMQRNASLHEIQGRQEVAAQQPETLTQVASPQNEVALDPTEERILFGSDDNIWAAFGKSSDTSGDACGPFGNGGLNGFSSLQSGTWSALVQSAVAETSGSDVGLQEHWSSLNFQNTVVPPGSQHPEYNEKQQTSFSTDLMASSLDSSAAPSSNSSMNYNYQNVLGFQQIGNKFACEPGNGLQARFSERLVNSSEEGSKWSSGGPLPNVVAEVPPIYGKASLSVDAEANFESPSGPWTSGQTGLKQQYSRPNCLNILPSVAHSGDTSVSIHESENLSQHSQDSEQKRVKHGKVMHRGLLWNSSSIPSSIVEAQHAKSPARVLPGNMDSFSVRNAAGMPNSITSAFNEEPNQYPSNSYHLNWQNVNPVMKSQGGESVIMSDHHVNQDDQAVESSFNSCIKEEAGTNETETCNKKENSSDNHPFSLSCLNSAGGLKENVLTDVSESRSLPSGKPKSANQISQKSSASRKFQFHPMGNLDEDMEPSYGMRQQSRLLATSQHGSHVGPSKTFGQFPVSYADLARQQSADQKDARGIDDKPTCGTPPDHIQNVSIPVKQSVDMYTRSKDSQLSSQNMLELLHKVDQSMPLGSSECNLSSEMPAAENSDGSVDPLQRSRGSASQGFGLQLGPPSHQTAVQNQPFSSQSSLLTVNTLDHSQSTPKIAEKGQSWRQFKNNRSGLPEQAGDVASVHKVPGASNSGFPYLRSEIHYQQTDRESGQASINQLDTSHSVKDGSLSRLSAGPTMESSLPDVVGSSFGATSQQSSANHTSGRSSAPQVLSREPVSVSPPLSASGIPLQGGQTEVLPNMWSNVPGQSHLMGAQFPKVSAHFPQLHQDKVLESTFHVPRKQDNQDARTGQTAEFAVSSMNEENCDYQVSTRNTNAVDMLCESQGSAPVPKNLSDVSPANSASMRKDLEAFGRLLKSNNVFHKSFSLLNKLRAMKSADSDPNERLLKRMKGAESGVEGQQVATETAQLSENNIEVVDAMTHHLTVASGDSRLLSLSGADNAETKTSPQHVNIASQNLLESSRDDSQSNLHGKDPAAVRVEHSHISPQMAPTWFSQYGTFRNGQMLAVYDAGKASTKERAEQPFTLGKSSGGLQKLNSVEQLIAGDADSCQISNQPRSTPISGAHFSSLQSVPLQFLRPKKRKRAMFELIPWNKEVSQGFQNLRSISVAEVDWAKAANRLTKRIEDAMIFVEDGPPMLRAQRRLTLTTQLMQQLLHPPRLEILSADADVIYESVVYSVARLGLGDVCGLVSHSCSDSDIPLDGVKLLSDKCKRSERVDDRRLSKVMEDFVGRARKLENDFLRLDKRASVLDLRLESQELEKISVINRFAKFHGRRQAENGDVSSSSGAAVNAIKPCPQRHVTALPIPRNLPDRLQCVSL